MMDTVVTPWPCGEKVEAGKGKGKGSRGQRATRPYPHRAYVGHPKLYHRSAHPICCDAAKETNTARTQLRELCTGSREVSCALWVLAAHSRPRQPGPGEPGQARPARSATPCQVFQQPVPFAVGLLYMVPGGLVYGAEKRWRRGPVRQPWLVGKGMTSTQSANEANEGFLCR